MKKVIIFQNVNGNFISVILMQKSNGNEISVTLMQKLNGNKISLTFFLLKSMKLLKELEFSPN